MKICPRSLLGMVMIGTFFLAACGLQREDERRSDSFVNLKELSISPAIIDDGKQIQVGWDVSYASPSGLYTFELHMGEDALALSDQTRVFSLNCPLHASCQSEGMALRVCEYGGRDSGQSASLTCSDSPTESKEISRTGNLLAIGRACIFDENAAMLCDSKSIEIHLG